MMLDDTGEGFYIWSLIPQRLWAKPKFLKKYEA